MYGIMRCEKRKINAIGGLEAEANRQEMIDLPASDVDWNLTKENVFLVRSDDWKQSIKDELQKYDITKHRKDAVVLIDSLYTASSDFFTELSKNEIIDYFTDCLDFHERVYGHVINAVVHFDERSPHLHIASVPLFQRDDKYILSAKALMGNRDDYRARQDVFYEEVSRKYDLERGQVSDPVLLKKHLSVQEFKIEKNEEDLSFQRGRKCALEHDVKMLEYKIDQLEDAIIDKRNELESLDIIRDLISEIADVIRNQIFDIDQSADLTDLEVLQIAADHCDAVIAEIDSIDDDYDPVD